jgi:ankyrin repeat protein
MFASKGNLIKVKQTVDLMMDDKVAGYDNVCKGDYDDRTALHLACSEGQFPVVQYLIESGFF